jgi:hypothetical protein
VALTHQGEIVSDSTPGELTRRGEGCGTGNMPQEPGDSAVQAKAPSLDRRHLVIAFGPQGGTAAVRHRSAVLLTRLI